MAKIDDLRARYERLSHAMQSGVLYVMEREPDETSPKHLRVGVNSSMVQIAALVSVLMEKGVITETEFFEAAIKLMEAEVESYEERLRAIYGGRTKISLL